MMPYMVAKKTDKIEVIDLRDDDFRLVGELTQEKEIRDLVQAANERVHQKTKDTEL